MPVTGNATKAADKTIELNLFITTLLRCRTVTILDENYRRLFTISRAWPLPSPALERPAPPPERRGRCSSNNRAALQFEDLLFPRGYCPARPDKKTASSSRVEPFADP